MLENTNKLGEYVHLKIKNISSLIKNQQRMSDKIYQDAIEANFSHEQMNPLNSILANSNIVYKRFY